MRLHLIACLALCLVAPAAALADPVKMPVVIDATDHRTSAIGTVVIDKDGNAVTPPKTDWRGGAVPSQGIITTTRQTLAASTATSLSPLNANRIGLTVQVETALTANVYLCTTQATGCSATSYDALIPSGSGPGSTYSFLFAPGTALYGYSTGTPTLVTNSWVAP